MIRGSLSRRYARALMAIGQEKGISAQLGGELDQLASWLEQGADFRLIIEAPVVGKDVRAKILDSICDTAGFHEVTRRFLHLLNLKGRLPQLMGIARAFQELLDEAQGRVRADVITAAPLSAEAENKIKQALARLTGKEIVMTAEVDASLIGGVVTRVEGKLLDGSVRTQLKSIEESLKTAQGA